jgi:hypothetical protein
MEELLLDKEDSKKLFDSLPNWHKKNPALLANALMRAKEVNSHFKGLADSLIPKMPRFIRASQNLRAINIENSSHLMTLENAIDCPWISFDAAKSRNCLLFDIDHPDALDLIEDLPENIRPTLIFDPYSGRSHGVLPLNSPVLRGGLFGPEILADLAHKLLSKHLKATPLPVGALIKNPWGRKEWLIGAIARRTPKPITPLMWEAHKQAKNGLLWHTVPGSQGAELRDIVAHLADEYEEVASKTTKRHFIHRGEPSALGRNCALFDLVRFWAYDNNETDGGNILDKANEINGTLQPPLPFPEVRATARSISRFMATRYKPKTKLETRRGVMGLSGSDMSIQTKQKLSAKRTADIKASNTEHKLKLAIKHFPEGRKLTQAALSEVSRIPLRTIKRYWKNLT